MQNSSTDLRTWLEQPVGSYVRAWEEACLARLTTDIFGFNAIQIGQPRINALAASRMPNKWLTNNVAEPESDRRIVVLHDFVDLPFESQSLDLVVLPHVLEFSLEPHQILREIERVLIPEGKVIICGFNPASMWGLRQAAGQVTGRYFLPKQGGFIRVPRLKDWLKLLSLEVDSTHFGCYAPPVNGQKWLSQFSLLEPVGRRWWTYFGAVYVIQAVKRVKGMHLIGPAIKRNPLRVHGGVPVANRHHHG